jgi:3'(2'), 5'-bisphosphate nucleotidase
MLDNELRTALALADEGARLALAIEQTDFAVDEKGPSDLVTEADRQVNQLLCGGLRAAFPNDLVVGEESGFTGTIDAPRAWFVDPIDGTADFVQRTGEWSIMIGLAVEGRARLGVVVQPATGDTYYAVHGQGAYHRVGSSRRKLRVSDIDAASEATVVGSRNHPDPRLVALQARLGITRTFQYGSIGCKLAQIAEQRADLYANFSGKCHLWDICGPEVLIREAGGALVDAQGQPVLYRGESTRFERPFIATTSRLLPSVLEAVRALEAEA